MPTTTTSLFGLINHYYHKCSIATIVLPSLLLTLAIIQAEFGIGAEPSKTTATNTNADLVTTTQPSNTATNVPVCQSPIDLSIPVDVGWLETVVFANFRIWHVMFSGIAILIGLTVVLCCLFRCRIPRTKQEIEADFIRKRITKSFRSHLNKIKLEELDPSNLLPVFQKVEVLEEDRVGKHFEERQLNWKQKIKRFIFGSKGDSYEEVEIFPDSKEAEGADYKPMTKEEMKTVESAVEGAKIDQTAFDVINDQIAILSYFESDKERRKRIKGEKKLEKKMLKEQKQKDKAEKKQQKIDDKKVGKSAPAPTPALPPPPLELRADKLKNLEELASTSSGVAIVTDEIKSKRRRSKRSSKDLTKTSDDTEQLEKSSQKSKESTESSRETPVEDDTIEEKGYQEISIPMPRSSSEQEEAEAAPVPAPAPAKKGFGFSFRNTVQKLMGKSWKSGSGSKSSKSSPSIVDSKSVVRDEMVINIELVKQSPTQHLTIPHIECPPDDDDDGRDLDQLTTTAAKKEQLKKLKHKEKIHRQSTIDRNRLQIPELPKTSKEINEQRRRDSLIETDSSGGLQLTEKEQKQKHKLDRKLMKKLLKQQKAAEAEEARRLKKMKSIESKAKDSSSGPTKKRLSIEEKRNLLQKQQPTIVMTSDTADDDTAATGDDLMIDDIEPDSISVVTIVKKPIDAEPVKPAVAAASAAAAANEEQTAKLKQEKELRMQQKKQQKEREKAAKQEAKEAKLKEKLERKRAKEAELAKARAEREAIESAQTSKKGSSGRSSVQSSSTIDTTTTTTTTAAPAPPPPTKIIEPIIVKSSADRSKTKSKVKKEVKIFLDPDLPVHKESTSRTSRRSVTTEESKPRSKDRKDKIPEESKPRSSKPSIEFEPPPARPPKSSKIEFSEIVDQAIKEKHRPTTKRLKRDIVPESFPEEPSEIDSVRKHSSRHHQPHKHHHRDSPRSTLTRQKTIPATPEIPATTHDPTKEVVTSIQHSTQRQHFNQLVLHLNEELKQKFAEQRRQKSAQQLKRSQTVDVDCFDIHHHPHTAGDHSDDDEFRLRDRDEFKKRLSEVLLQKLTTTSTRIELTDPKKEQGVPLKSTTMPKRFKERSVLGPPPAPPTSAKPSSVKSHHHRRKIPKQGTSGSSEMEIPIEHVYTGSDIVEVHPPGAVSSSTASLATLSPLPLIQSPSETSSISSSEPHQRHQHYHPFRQPTTQSIQTEHSNIVEKFIDKSPTGDFNRELKIERTRDVMINVDPRQSSKSRKISGPPVQFTSQAILQSESIVVDPSKMMSKRPSKPTTTTIPESSFTTTATTTATTTTSSTMTRRHKTHQKLEDVLETSKTLPRDHRLHSKRSSKELPTSASTSSTASTIPKSHHSSFGEKR